MAEIALQLYSIKELTEVDFLGTLEKVTKIGYKGVEFAGYFDTPAKTLKDCLDTNGLKAAGSHVGIEQFDDNLGQIIEYAQMIDNKNIICPWLPEEMRNSTEAYKRTAEKLNKIGEKLRVEGLFFGYHNHEFEFEIFDNEFGIDLLYKNTDPQNLFVELDTFWVEFSGYNSVDFIEKYKERMKILHIKEMNNKLDKKNTEIGKGIMDFKSITAKGKEFNTEWFIVEQETFDIPQLQSINESFNYLKNIV